MTKNYTNLFLSLLLTLFALTGFSQQLAFPTAKGAGAYTTGGRGGQVIHVTNLNASGPGSFYEALQATGTRTIVFDVGGVIDMRPVTGFYVPIMEGSQHDNVTIAGQTAPGGITIEGYSFFFNRVDNVIMRYVRVKHVSIPDKQEDGAFIRGTNLIFDNCTFLNGKDETVSFYDTVESMGKVTLQNSLIGNGKTGMIMGGRDGDFADNTYSLLENLFVDISHRFPNTSPYSDAKYDIINNVVYGAKLRYVTMGGGDGQTYANSQINVNYVNNYNKISSFFRDIYGNYEQDNFHQIQEYSLNPTNKKIFSGGNIVTGWIDTPQATDFELWTNFNYSGWGNGEWNYVPLQEFSIGNGFTTTQNQLLGQPFSIKSAEQAYTDVVANAGANAYLNDSHAKVTYTETQEDYLRQKVINDSATDHGGWNESNATYGNTHTGLTRPSDWDTDQDGMPDSWEDANGHDKNVPDDSGDSDGNGYTNLEDYLNLIDGAVVTVDVTGVTVSPSTATLNIPETITLTSTVQPADASNQSGVWSSNNTNIATVNSSGVVTPVGVGQVVITFNTNDGGFSDSATITVTNTPIGVESVSLSPETLDLNINGTDLIVATILPANASDQTGVWTSSDPAVATVDQQGMVQPIAIGQTTITFTTNDGGFSDTSVVTINNDSFGDYEFYNADTDVLIQAVEGGEVFDLDAIGENVNFRVIPLGGDANPAVESVGIQWNGIETGNYAENAPLYAGMTGHIGNDYEAYTVTEGTYNFTVTYYSEDNQSGNVVATDNFELSFTRSSANQVVASEDDAICEGDTSALSASGADSYLWSTGETSETIAVTPNVTTTYTVTGTHSDGSTTQDSVTVTVNQTPTVDAGLDQATCGEEEVVLTATATAGSITWSNGATTASITVNPATTTTYSVTVDNNGCVASDDVTVTVNSLPIADAGNDISIVLGESATLTASGGATYVWSTGETTSSIVVNPTVDTTYNVSVTSAEGCSSGDSVTVTIVEAIEANAGDDVLICSGESTTLTASGGAIYEWSTGETTPSITVSPNATTSYSVIVSNQDQTSSDTDSVTVTVADLPTAGVSDDSTIASGETVDLVATGGDTYLWSTGETADSIIVSPTSSTTYTVTAYNANGCSDDATVTVTVISEVVANAGDDVAICEGDSTTLTASGGDTYSWSTGETTQSITVNPLNTTKYTVVVSDQYSSDSDDVLVTVNPLPVVSAGDDVTINAGESVTLYGSGGNTYLWSTGETNANISVSPLVTTTYTVSTTINGCSDSDDVTVIINNTVNASAGDDQEACPGADVTLTASGGDSYEWSTGETSQSIVVSPQDTTTYTVIASTAFGSGSDDVTVNITNCVLEDETPEILDFSFKAYPNPSDGDLNVKITGLHTSGVVMVTDILGNNLKYIELEENGGQTRLLNVNLTSVAKGLYLVTLYSDNRTVTKKIVKN